MRSRGADHASSTTSVRRVYFVKTACVNSDCELFEKENVCSTKVCGFVEVIAEPIVTCYYPGENEWVNRREM